MILTEPNRESRPLALLNRSLAVTTVLAALIVAAVFWLGARSKSDDAWVRHSLDVRAQLTQVLGLVQSAETGQRGYLLTGQDIYLRPYRLALTQLPVALQHTKDLTSDNPEQERPLDRLSDLIGQKLAELQSTLDAYNAGGKDAALAIVNSDKGLQLMQDVRRAAEDMQAKEDRLLADRQRQAARSEMLLQAAVALAFLLICSIGFLIARFTRGSFGVLAEARDRLAAANRQLLDQIARREMAEGQLRQAQKMEALGQLTGGIAHDFNNMLGVIMGALELVKRRVAKGDYGIERFIDAATIASERAATLTQRLLAFARQQPLSPQPLDANKMIANMTDLLQSTLGEHIHIETVTAAGLWTVNVDSQQLEHALLNIAINSRDAMPEGGKLTLETANAYLDEAYCAQNPEIEPGQFAMIAITDTGVGMTPDIVARAFDPFFTTKAAGKGTGLGLEPSLRLHQAIERPHQGLQRARRRYDGETLPAAVGRRRPRNQAHHSRADAHRRAQRNHPGGRRRPAHAAAGLRSAARTRLYGVRLRQRRECAGDARPRRRRQALVHRRRHARHQRQEAR